MEAGQNGEEQLPEVAPNTPPDSATPWGVCPRCGHRSQFAFLGNLPVTVEEHVRLSGGIPADSYWLERVSVFQCRGCGQDCAVIEEKWIGDHPAREGWGSGGDVSWRGIHWWPTPGTADLDPAIPKELRDAYSEGVRCLGANAPRAAAVMFRRTVEGIVKDRGSQKAKDQLDNRDLAGALKIMAKEGALVPSLAEWAEEVRGLGNVGGHFDPLEDVTREQAGELANLVRQVFRYLYEEPARVERLRASRKPTQ